MPISYFSYEQQTVKGPRANTDNGTPVDASRPFDKNMQGGTASCGSWGCTEGGWLSPNPRASTEYFLVLDGRGSVDTEDGRRFPFGPGDVVVLPKGWSGRWDVYERIHKIWLVHNHEDVPGASTDPVVTTFDDLVDVPAASSGAAAGPARRGKAVYDVGGTRVGCWTSAPGSFAVAPRPVAECLTVLSGTFFLTNADGSARRCAAGDTVSLPEGWSGHFDVVEPVATVFAEVAAPGKRVEGDVGAKYAGVSSAPAAAKPAAAAAAGGAARGRGLAGSGRAIYEVGPAVTPPAPGSPAAAVEADRVRYEVALKVLETSDDAELKAKAREQLLAFLG